LNEVAIISGNDAASNTVRNRIFGFFGSWCFGGVIARASSILICFVLIFTVLFSTELIYSYITTAHRK